MAAPHNSGGDPRSGLAWLGHLSVRGLFDGEHVFTVEDLGEGRSRLVQSERFSGLLLRRYGADEQIAA